MKKLDDMLKTAKPAVPDLPANFSSSRPFRINPKIIEHRRYIGLIALFEKITDVIFSPIKMDVSALMTGFAD